MKYMILTLSLLAFSCTTGREAVIKRAPFDLSCDESKMKVTELGDEVFGVEGCGRKATYVINRTKHSGPIPVLNTIDGQPAKQNTP